MAVPGGRCIVTGEDAQALDAALSRSRSRRRDEQWCLAVDRVRYVGEPVAVALARDRYAAEDALEQIAVTYRPLPAVIDPVARAETDAPLLHTALGCNVVSDRVILLRRSRSGVRRGGAPDHDHDQIPT